MPKEFKQIKPQKERTTHVDFDLTSRPLSTSPMILNGELKMHDWIHPVLDSVVVHPIRVHRELRPIRDRLDRNLFFSRLRSRAHQRDSRFLFRSVDLTSHEVATLHFHFDVGQLFNRSCSGNRQTIIIQWNWEMPRAHEQNELKWSTLYLFVVAPRNYWIDSLACAI